MSSCLVRPATFDDLPRIAAIYAHFVATSTATFELDPPDAAEIGRRMQAVHELGLPYLAAECDGQVVGYAYATQFRPRPAYRFTVEDSVYLDAAWGGRGLGSLLLAALIEGCRVAGSHQMIAAIGGDNPASINMHAAHGFQQMAVLPEVGFKFGRWVNMTLMQRAL